MKHQRQIEKRAQINLSERDRLSRQVNDLNDLKESLEKQLRQLEKDYSDQTTKYQVITTVFLFLRFMSLHSLFQYSRTELLSLGSFNGSTLYQYYHSIY